MDRGHQTEDPVEEQAWACPSSLEAKLSECATAFFLLPLRRLWGPVHVATQSATHTCRGTRFWWHLYEGRFGGVDMRIKIRSGNVDERQLHPLWRLWRPGLAFTLKLGYCEAQDGSQGFERRCRRKDRVCARVPDLPRD